MDSTNTSDTEGEMDTMGHLAWGDLPPSARAAHQELLLAWVRDFLVQAYPSETEPLIAHPCTPHHADVVLSLRAVAAQFQADFYPSLDSDGGVVPGELVPLLEWQVELGRASERWAISFRGCTAKRCGRPVDDEARSRRERWMEAMLAAARDAWGITGDPPLRSPEPWEAMTGQSEGEPPAPAGYFRGGQEAEDQVGGAVPGAASRAKQGG